MWPPRCFFKKYIEPSLPRWRCMCPWQVLDRGVCLASFFLTSTISSLVFGLNSRFFCAQFCNIVERQRAHLSSAHSKGENNPCLSIGLYCADLYPPSGCGFQSHVALCLYRKSHCLKIWLMMVMSGGNNQVSEMHKRSKLCSAKDLTTNNTLFLIDLIMESTS